ncbi:hypothetical protein HU200_009266 [Digitaria exilis]|uniref:Reverse transcriptase zinc-binding domain-containing protein n=1 Tax=Digitaria exilis TaxID=1010633 RepID=A0A835FKH5_9POAL|nr:hypothetical protein HU200_009266 [Digitaria exilis]
MDGAWSPSRDLPYQLLQWHNVGQQRQGGSRLAVLVCKLVRRPPTGIGQHGGVGPRTHTVATETATRFNGPHYTRTAHAILHYLLFTDTSDCPFCLGVPEKTAHLFVTCPRLIGLWARLLPGQPTPAMCATFAEGGRVPHTCCYGGAMGDLKIPQRHDLPSRTRGSLGVSCPPSP